MVLQVSGHVVENAVGLALQRLGHLLRASGQLVLQHQAVVFQVSGHVVENAVGLALHLLRYMLQVGCQGTCIHIELLAQQQTITFCECSQDRSGFFQVLLEQDLVLPCGGQHHVDRVLVRLALFASAALQL